MVFGKVSVLLVATAVIAAAAIVLFFLFAATVVVTVAIIVTAAAIAEDLLLILEDEILCADPVHDSDISADTCGHEEQQSEDDVEESHIGKIESEVHQCDDRERGVDDGEIEVTLPESHERDDGEQGAHTDGEIETDGNGRGGEACVSECAHHKERESLGEECLVQAEESDQYTDGCQKEGQVYDTCSIEQVELYVEQPETDA